MRSRLPHTALIVLCLLLIGGCSRAPRGAPEEFFALHQNPYFPLALGNRWEYATQDSSVKHLDRTLIVEAKRYLFLRGQWYVVMQYDWFGHGVFYYHQTMYWTYGNQSQILWHDSLHVADLPKNTNPYLYADFDARLGTEWPVNWGNVTRTKLAARKDSVQVGEHWYQDCVILEVKEGLDDEWPVAIYAKDIGLVRKGPYSLLRCEIHNPTNGGMIRLRLNGTDAP